MEREREGGGLLCLKKRGAQKEGGCEKVHLKKGWQENPESILEWRVLQAMIPAGSGLPNTHCGDPSKHTEGEEESVAGRGVYGPAPPTVRIPDWIKCWLMSWKRVNWVSVSRDMNLARSQSCLEGYKRKALW